MSRRTPRLEMSDVASWPNRTGRPVLVNGEPMVTKPEPTPLLERRHHADCPCVQAWDLPEYCRCPAGWPRRERPAGAPRRGRLNKTETRYSQRLDADVKDGRIARWRFEGVTLRLADGARYTPDFAVTLPDGRLEMHETKGGFIREAAMVRLKVAAELFPEFEFILAQWKRGEWTIKRVG